LIFVNIRSSWFVFSINKCRFYGVLLNIE